jgi:hypothetical protein
MASAVECADAHPRDLRMTAFNLGSLVKLWDRTSDNLGKLGTYFDSVEVSIKKAIGLEYCTNAFSIQNA